MLIIMHNKIFIVEIIFEDFVFFKQEALYERKRGLPILTSMQKVPVSSKLAYLCYLFYYIPLSLVACLEIDIKYFKSPFKNPNVGNYL